MSERPREFSILPPEDWEDIRELVEKLENVEVAGRSNLVDKLEQLEKRLDSVSSSKGLALELCVRT
jgi:hypothetical protein